MLTPELLTAMLKFRSDRDWEQFHTPRNIASALSVEAAELLEHFVWSREKQTAQIVEEHRATILDLPRFGRHVSVTQRPLLPV